MNQVDETHLRLSAQRALLGNVPSSLRSASIEITETTIRFRCQFDKSASENDLEILRYAGTEIKTQMLTASFTAFLFPSSLYI